jgi:hypothetical protein
MPSEETNVDPPFTSPDLTTRLAPPHKKQRREEEDEFDFERFLDGFFSHQNKILSGKDVTGWSEKRILEAVRDEVGESFVSPLIQHKSASAYDARP